MPGLGDCFVMMFVTPKSITCKTFWRTVRDCSRPVRDACKDFAIPCERLAMVYSSHPSEIRALREVIEKQ